MQCRAEELAPAGQDPFQEHLGARAGVDDLAVTPQGHEHLQPVEVQLEQVNAGQVVAMEPPQEGLDGLQGGLRIAVVLLLGGQAAGRRPGDPGVGVAGQLGPLLVARTQEAPDPAERSLSVEGGRQQGADLCGHVAQEPEEGDAQGQDAQACLIAARVPGGLDSGSDEARTVVGDALIAPGDAPQAHEGGTDEADRVAQLRRQAIRAVAVGSRQEPVELLKDDGLIVGDLPEETVVAARLGVTGIAEVAGFHGKTDLGAQVHRPLAQGRAGLGLVAGGGQLRQSEVADGDEHVETRQAVVTHHEQGVGDQGVEEVGGLRTDERLRRHEGEAVREQGQPGQGATLGGVEQVPGPLDDRCQGALTGWGVAGSGEQIGSTGQALSDLADRQAAGARGGQLNGQGNTLQPSQELGQVVIIDDLVGASGQGAGAEELGGGGGIEGLEAVDVLRGQVEGAARGRQDAQVGAGHQEWPDEVGRLAGQVLAVVQHQDGSGLEEGGGQIPAWVAVDDCRTSDGVEHDPGQISPG